MGSYLTGTIGTRYLWFNRRMGAMTSPGRRTAGDYAEPVAQARNITAHSRVGTRGCTKVTIVPEVSFEKKVVGEGGGAESWPTQTHPPIRELPRGTSNYVNPDCAALTDLPDCIFQV